MSVVLCGLSGMLGGISGGFVIVAAFASQQQRPCCGVTAHGGNANVEVYPSNFDQQMDRIINTYAKEGE